MSEVEIETLVTRVNMLGSVYIGQHGDNIVVAVFLNAAATVLICLWFTIGYYYL